MKNPRGSKNFDGIPVGGRKNTGKFHGFGEIFDTITGEEKGKA